MTHRLQVRVDRQITPRPGRNITRKWVYERSFSVHLLTQDSLNSHWAFQSASFSRSGYLSVLLACCGAFSSVPPLGLTFWRLCCLDCNTFDYLQDWAVDTETTFHELRVAYCVDYRRVFINTDGRAFCHVPWNVSLLTWMYVKLERCNTGSMLWICLWFHSGCFDTFSSVVFFLQVNRISNLRTTRKPGRSITRNKVGTPESRLHAKTTLWTFDSFWCPRRLLIHHTTAPPHKTDDTVLVSQLCNSWMFLNVEGGCAPLAALL